jgi:hypothetical protein
MTGHKPKLVFWNMLIGGPNQSHKVNFKEPASAMGKISKKTSVFFSVNPFSEKKKNAELRSFPEASFDLPSFS